MDLNKDGYDDVIVSAPFGNDGGEISIFNGNSQGIVQAPSQVFFYTGFTNVSHVLEVLGNPRKP